MLAAVSLLGLLVSSAAQAAPTVCSIAINSTEEIEVFKRNLKPQGFKFVEIASDPDPSRNWFDRACRIQEQCDILVISGHFAGSFFGESGLQLSMDHLNANRCMQNCDGILKKPKEVFLFGCNTLAGKERDSRTPEQYRQVLMNDGIPEELATRVAAARYSPLGFSYRDRMLQAFSGVPMIHGFDSVGPKGKHVASKLQAYFDQIGDYREHLKQLSVGQVEKATTTWNTALIGTSRISAPGAPEVDHGQCSLFDPRYSTFDHLRNIQALLKGDQIGSYLIMVGDYLLKTRTQKLDRSERALFEEILAKSPARDAIISFLPFFKPTDPMYEQLYKMLTLWPEDPRVRPMLLKALGDDGDFGVQFAVASQFIGTDDADYVHALIQLLHSNLFMFVRIAAIESLETTKSPEAYQAILNASTHDVDMFVRKRALTALKKFRK